MREHVTRHALIVIAAFVSLAASSALAQKQDDVSKAMDSTATQWSFQFAYQTMPDYYRDTLADGSTRPAGFTDYLQMRIVAPLVYDRFTILPRLFLKAGKRISRKRMFKVALVVWL